MPPSSSPALPLNVTPSATPSRPTATGSPAAAATNPTATKASPNPSDISSPHELTAFVESLLEQLDAKFDDMSSQILDRMEQMSTRVDALEVAIHDIISTDATAGPLSVPPSPAFPQRKGSSG
ncbi:heat shock factor binding protein 1-domain-containing protein [Amylocystis lapponica]|nr:heat shock factor binding protein 1-domain-containing protein [Amylocystis lapponica]